MACQEMREIGDIVKSDGASEDMMIQPKSDRLDFHHIQSIVNGDRVFISREKAIAIKKDKIMNREIDRDPDYDNNRR
jgi:hypothetical protein